MVLSRCAVINIAISLRHDVPQNWDTNIYLSPQIVPPTERSQIETRLQAWAESLEVRSQIRDTINFRALLFASPPSNKTSSPVLHPSLNFLTPLHPRDTKLHTYYLLIGF